MTIGKGRYQAQQRDTGKRLRINDQIRISPIRLIDEDNNQIGIIDLDNAKQRAHDAGLDLVEVAGTSKPPVCRIMDYGKWKYQQKKKEQKARSHSKNSELKEVRLRPKIDDHDLMIKMGKAREFLTEGDKVQFTMQFRGREMAHKGLGLQTLRDICDKLADISKVETAPRGAAGRRMTMVLSPDNRAKTKAPRPKPQGETAPAREGTSSASQRAAAAPSSPQAAAEPASAVPPVATSPASSEAAAKQ